MLTPYAPVCMPRVQDVGRLARTVVARLPDESGGLGAVKMNGDGGEKPPPAGVETPRIRMRNLRIAS